MADDAGALLVRSGLVSANALDEARARVTSAGGTIGEQLVTSGTISDEALTDFYRARLLVPQVNPNMLARLPPKVVATIPSDMAIELRAIPVSLDGDNNLTVAMSDPSDRHAVDEIAFFTGAYIVRAVATQMQIAWCLAHYYGHVTSLGQRLLYPSGSPSPGPAPASAPTSTSASAAQLLAPAPAPPTPSVPAPRSTPSNSTPAASFPDPAIRTPTPPTPVSMPASAPQKTSTRTPAVAPPEPPEPTPVVIVLDETSDETGDDETGDDETGDDAPTIRRPSSPEILAPSGGPPARPRTRDVSGEIRAPVRRAASIRPPIPPPDGDDDDEPLIVIERNGLDEDTTGPRRTQRRRRVVKSDPPELYARAGEVDLKAGADRSIDVDEPRIVIDESALATPATAAPNRAPNRAVAAPRITPSGFEDIDTTTLTSNQIIDAGSQPILLDRLRPAPGPFQPPAAPSPAGKMPAPGQAQVPGQAQGQPPGKAPSQAPSQAPGKAPSQAPGKAPSQAPGKAQGRETDNGESTVIVLETKKPRTRPERRTQVGIPPAPVPVRPHRDTETSGIPAMLADPERDRTVPVDEDATTLDIQPAPRGDDPSDQIVAPPAPASYGESNPHFLAPPPSPAPRRPPMIRPAVIVDDGSDGPDAYDDEDEPSGPRTSVMTAVELDDAIPDRTEGPGWEAGPPGPMTRGHVEPGHLARRRIDHDAVDDGWGPPGTTIPPPLLGAIPGGDEDDDDDGAPSVIPMPSVDSSPLIVTPPSLPSSGDATGRALVRALEDATARAIQVIRELEHAQSRDQVVDVMVAHLAESHHRAGFLVARNTKIGSELGLFAMTPKPAVMPFATLRLDRPSTLQDVVGTRLPYRGPMHDDASRTFLIAVLGACPPEILLVPVAVRERVVGVLFGEHRQRHTFDDQLALAARAAGMALERILKAKRG